MELETWPEVTLRRRALQREAWYAIQNLLGDAGSAAADLTVLRFEFGEGTGHAVVRVRRGQTGEARAALACLDAVGDDPVGVRVLGTSGTIRACEEKYIRGPTEPPSQRHVVFENADRRAVARDQRVDVRTDEAFIGATELDFR